MEDEELQAIRAQRMAQLQNQYAVSLRIYLVGLSIIAPATNFWVIYINQNIVSCHCLAVCIGLAYSTFSIALAVIATTARRK